MNTLYDQVKQQVEDELGVYKKDVDIFEVWDRINEMTNVELLQHISRALEGETK